MNAVRISLPAEATLVAAVLSAVARATDRSVEVHASRDGAELALEVHKVAGVDADPPQRPSAAGAAPSPLAAPAPSPHPALTLEGDSPAAPPDEPELSSHGGLEVPGASMTSVAVEAGAGADIHRCAECGAEFIATRASHLYCSTRCRTKVKERNRSNRMQAAAPPRPANPLARQQETYDCSHCAASFDGRKALGLHVASDHPFAKNAPVYVPPDEEREVVRHHGSRRWSA